MAMVAEAYRDGLGTRPDPVAAENWFRGAVEAGSVTAMLEYGRMLVDRRDEPQSVQRGVALLERAAANATPYVWSTLGELHINGAFPGADPAAGIRSEEHTSELQSLMRISYAVFCLKKKKKTKTHEN